jgi:hypothetical protein
VATKAGSLLTTAEEVQEEIVGCSEAAVLEASKGNPDSSHIDNVIVVESDSTMLGICVGCIIAKTNILVL